MHELGVVIEVVKTVEAFAKENGVEKIEALVLQIGELSAMIPAYIEACYPCAVEGTILEHAELRIEILPGNARCKECGKIYNFLETEGVCPDCRVKKPELLGGREFMIKEIVAS